MKLLTCILLVVATCSVSFAASVQFGSTGGTLESIQINDEITFTVTSALEDTSFILVFNDLFQGNTFSPDESFTPNIIAEPSALVNDSPESSFTFPWLIRETQWDDELHPFTAGYDPLDLSVVFAFMDGFSLIAGDTITLNVGTIFTQIGYDIPKPDNLGSTLVAHLVASNFDQRISADQTSSIVPETSFAIPVSLLCLFMCLVRRPRLIESHC